MANESDSNVVATRTLFNDEALSEIKSYEDAVRLLQESGIPAETMADYGTGFGLEKEKEGLLKTPFLILQWRFNPGDYDDKDFVSIELVTKHGDKLIINDGSTGIAKQLRTVTDRRTKLGRPDTHSGLVVPNGLTKADYFFNENTKETSTKPREGKGWGPATTYYLSES